MCLVLKDVDWRLSSLDPLLDLVKLKDKTKGGEIGYYPQESQRGVSLEHTSRLQLIARTAFLKYKEWGHFSENWKRSLAFIFTLAQCHFIQQILGEVTLWPDDSPASPNKGYSRSIQTRIPEDLPP